VAAWNGLTIVHLQLQEYSEAAQTALESIAIIYYQPQPHFWLGLALSELGEWSRALEAIMVTLSIQPGHLGAQRQLATIKEAIE